MKVVSNTTSAFEGLKTILHHLFSEEALRVSSLKGITTVAGGASTALDKEKLNIVYCVSAFLQQNTKIPSCYWPAFNQLNF